MEQAEVKMKKNKKSKKGGFDGGYGGGSYTDSGTGGGGYMQSPGGFGSPSATQGERKSQRSRSQQIVPCTVSQLLSAAQVDEVFKIREVELSQVTIVGVVRHAEKAPTNILYKVDDMTAAPMDVRQWVDTDNKKSLVAFKIMPLEDMNEFISHMLEVVHAHMLLNKVQTMPAGGGASHGLTTPVRPGTADMGGGYTGASDMYVNGLTPHQSQVLNLIKSCRAAEGMSIQELKNRLKGMNIMTIKQAVEFLSNEGHIYSTVDEDHYRSTDAD
ncbi:replication protein A 32 kDa subunit isoform X4 [Protopterus annectens]|uniref:replication protein A 32 kDa subunit isoform X4 n=1 Tax=Protopterus annectens TaxID=7888 RepID=UPI001CFB51B3|nr:replication protein A 32 kDa subunit isoform X4 [Protopterus annectens]